jgi:hypothetical protein
LEALLSLCAGKKSLLSVQKRRSILLLASLLALHSQADATWSSAMASDPVRIHTKFDWWTKAWIPVLCALLGAAATVGATVWSSAQSADLPQDRIRKDNPRDGSERRTREGQPAPRAAAEAHGGAISLPTPPTKASPREPLPPKQGEMPETKRTPREPGEAVKSPVGASSAPPASDPVGGGAVTSGPKPERSADADEPSRVKPALRAAGTVVSVASGFAASAPEAAPAGKSPAEKSPAPKKPTLLGGCSGGTAGGVFGITAPQDGSIVPRDMYMEGTGPVDGRLRVWLNVYSPGQRASYMFLMLQDASGAWAFPLGLGNPDGDWGVTYPIVYHVMTRDQEQQAGLQEGKDKVLLLTHWSTVPGAVCSLAVTRESAEAALAAALKSPFKR